MACLWDTSNKTFGDMNYYDRKNNIWYDEKIRDNFKLISKGKNINPLDFYLNTNMDNTTDTTPDGNLRMNIGNKKVTKVIFNAKITSNSFSEIEFCINSLNKKGEKIEEKINPNNGQKLYDGNYIFIIDVRKKDYNDYVEVKRYYGFDYIKFNYFALEFEEYFLLFDYNSYKSVLNDIN